MKEPELPQPPATHSQRATLVFGVLALVILAAMVVPQFLRMPLTNDAQLYDLQTRMMLNGGVLYQDIFEPNLPGIVWVHAGVRSLVGWSSEGLRAFDLLVFAITLSLVNLWFRSQGWPASTRVLLVLGCSLFYLSQSEWCHCQRDIWLLFPVILALNCRRSLIEKSGERPSVNIVLRAFVEGAIWGCAIWLKPHSLLFAASVWVISQWIAGSNRRLLPDFVGVLLGGIVVGAVGVIWMVQQGCWPAFWETIVSWNPQYLAARSDHWSLARFLGMSGRLFPWLLLHIPAVVIAMCSLIALKTQQGNTPSNSRSQVLFNTCYLVWTIQAFFLQHLFDYVHIPPIFLAIGVVASGLRSPSGKWVPAAVLSFFCLAIVGSPHLRFSRIPLWQACLKTEVTPELQDQLTFFQNPSWTDLDRLAGFLSEQNVSHRDVCCFQSDLVFLYNRLELLPPTRFVYVSEITTFFPQKKAMMLDELKATPHRFVVSNMASAGLTPEEKNTLTSDRYQKTLLKIDPKKRTYPWRYPIVFRAGDYLVHQVVPSP